MNNREIYDRLLECAETEIKQWRRADKLTPIEQEMKIDPVVSGICRAGLYILPTEDYYRLKEEILKMGVNI